MTGYNKNKLKKGILSLDFNGCVTGNLFKQNIRKISGCLPPEIKVLEIQDNHLQHLPYYIHYSKFNKLRIYDNPFQSFPLSLGKTNIRYLSVIDTKLYEEYLFSNNWYSLDDHVTEPLYKKLYGLRVCWLDIIE